MIDNPENNEENEGNGHGQEAQDSFRRWLQKRMATARDEPQSGERSEEDERVPDELGHPETSAEDLEMLSLVINDALEGIDITRRYPTFYRRLLADPHLRQIFLDAIELLGESEAGELDPLPEPAKIDLSFLATDENEATSLPSPAERLRITLTRTRQQLRDLFAPPPAAVPMRDALTGLEDDYIILLRSNVPTEQGEFEVILEGRRPAAANALLPLVMVIPPEDAVSPLPLEATLQWGSYRETKPLDPHGRASLPPLPLEAILDEEGDVLAGLKLRLA